MNSGVVLGVCLQLAAVPQVSPQFVATTNFTLAWTHTIEKVRWEENYQVHYDRLNQKARLYAVVARIKGSAAGMEPPDGAWLQKGWYHYKPTDSYPTELRLTRSEFSADYEWCTAQGCVPLSAKFPRDGGVTLLTACTQSDD